MSAHRCNDNGCPYFEQPSPKSCACHKTDEQMLRERVKELADVARAGWLAVGDHYAPHDCYATGPLTGDPIRDLVQCPACAFLAMYETAFPIVRAPDEKGAAA